MVKGWLAAVMVIELAFSGVEAAIYLMVGWFVDLLNKHSPQTIFHDYGWLPAGAAFVVLVIRRILFFMVQVVTNQIVVPSLTNQIRWRNHIYILGHSLTLERAKTVGFSIPYAVYYSQAVVGKNSGIKSVEDMHGKRIAAAIGTLPEQEWLKIAKQWGEEKNYKATSQKTKSSWPWRRARPTPASQPVLPLSRSSNNITRSLPVQLCHGSLITHRFSDPGWMSPDSTILTCLSPIRYDRAATPNSGPNMSVAWFPTLESLT